jgi:hypothetical protein
MMEQSNGGLGKRSCHPYIGLSRVVELGNLKGLKRDKVYDSLSSLLEVEGRRWWGLGPLTGGRPSAFWLPYGILARKKCRQQPPYFVRWAYRG